MWYRLAHHHKVPDPEKLKQELSSDQFVDWAVFLEQVEWRERNKLEYYLAALRFDLNLLFYRVRKFFGDSDAQQPELEKMFLNFGDAMKGEVGDVAEGQEPDCYNGDGKHGYLMEGDDGDFDKGYGMPGIEIGKTPLDEKWQQINDEEKLKWGALMSTGLIAEYRPAPGSE